MCIPSDSASLQESAGSGAEWTVLVVDDDPDMTAVADAYLERLDGVSVRTSSDPDAALARLSEVDCVVSDYEMPGMDGFALLDAVRSSRPALPFVVFTGSPDGRVAERARDRGARYVEKGPAGGGFDRLASEIKRLRED